jgi:hypothetical protein
MVSTWEVVMIHDTFDGVTSRNRDLFDNDTKPRIIKPYLAECPCCGERFPYHPELFPTCCNPECPRVLASSSSLEFPALQSRPIEG